MLGLNKVGAAIRWGALASLAGALAGCASTSSSGDPGDNTFGNLISGRTAQAAATGIPTRQEIKVDCPIVQVGDGQAAFRAYTGADRSSAGVRYQYSFGDLSRECVATPDKRIELRVGVSGYVLAGPSGASGTFNVPVKVTVRNESNQAVVASKILRIATSIPPGESQSTFSAVTETMSFPFLSSEADEDYSIIVGFDGGAPEKPQRQARRRR